MQTENQPLHFYVSLIGRFNMQMTVSDELTLDLAEKTVGLLFKAYREQLNGNRGDNKNNSTEETTVTDPPAADPAPGVLLYNKWQIPFSYKDDQKNYQKAYAVCRKYNLPYPEALKRAEEETNGVILQPAAENVETPQGPGWKDIIHNTANQKHDPVIRMDGVSDELIALMPDARPESTVEKKNKIPPPDPVMMNTVPATTVVAGRHARQVKEDRGDLIYGRLLILARERLGAIIVVRDDDGKQRRIDARCLELLPEAA